MSNTLQLKIAELGYCCLRRFIRETMAWRTNHLAREVGVTPRWIRNCRRKYRLGEIKECERCQNPCPSEKQKQ